MQLKKYFAFLVAALVLTMTAMPSLAQAPTAGAGLTVPVQGNARGAGRVTGTFTIHRFVDNGGQLGAFGTMVLTTAQGQTAVTQTVVPVTANHRPAAATAASAAAAVQAVCEIVDLTLGPLDLNLLGLLVHLDTVHLDIDADPTLGLLGQLLGGLLCGSDLGGIFGSLTTLVGFLNSVLQALGGILGGV